MVPSYKYETMRSNSCHGLVPWSITLVPTKDSLNNSQMPRARPVELHARSYAGATGRFQMPRACPVELLVRSLQIVESLDDLAETERYESFAY